MSGCPERLVALSAYHDAELEPGAATELEGHLAGCPACRGELEGLAAVSASVRAALAASPVAGAPDVLRARVARALADVEAGQAASAPGAIPGASSSALPDAAPWAAPTDPAPVHARPRGFGRLSGRAPRALAAAAVVLLAAGIGYRVGSRRGDAAAQAAVTAELLSGHLRALLPGRLTDVVSSDRHQVKPWFAGRLDFSPPVPDLAAQGFPLVGGRLDFVAGERAAVLVYRRRLHLVDVFVLPATSRVPVPARARLGYNFLAWREGALRFIAVSDLDPVELRQLATLHAAAAGPTR